MSGLRTFSAHRGRPSVVIHQLTLGFAAAAALAGVSLPSFGADADAGDRPGGSAGRAALAPVFSQTIRPLLGKHCLGCHSTEKHKGDLDLERFVSIAEVLAHPGIWQGVVEQVSLGEMPPAKEPQPDAVARDALLVWIGAALDVAARERAGDPGPVVLRRLSNAEYTYTLRDLTRVDSLDPAREFPADSASGEGFMNVGNSLVMSPALLTKYLDAAKEIAGHAVLLPDGIRFSKATTRRDWTEERIEAIRNLYRRHTVSGGGFAVDLQGIKFDTRDGGVLPIERYLDALLRERNGDGKAGSTNVAGLNSRYLRQLRETLDGGAPSPVLDPIRERWRTAKPHEAALIAEDIARMQAVLWRFNPVGHIGKAGGPKAWMEPVNPLQPRQEVRFRIPATNSTDVTLYLVAGSAGDDGKEDAVIWERPRLVAPGRPDLLLRDVQELSSALLARRTVVVASASKCLDAAAEAEGSADVPDVGELAGRHGVDADVLPAWLDYLGIGSGGAARIEGWLTNRLEKVGGYDFIRGWGSPNTPSVVANASDQAIRIPGNMKPGGVAVHPSPTLAAVVGWRSPVATSLRVEARIRHAHPECGNGVTWFLEVRRGGTRRRLASGVAQGANEAKPSPIADVAVRPGDVVALGVGPRDGNHSCDLTAVDLSLTTSDGRAWDLARELAPDGIALNPHADGFGNAGVWNLFVEPDKGGGPAPSVPAGSLLAAWQASTDRGAKHRLAGEIQRLLEEASPGAKDSPDAVLHRQLTSLGGPLLGATMRKGAVAPGSAGRTRGEGQEYGLDAAFFGVTGDGTSMDDASFGKYAPVIFAVRLPADLAAGAEFVADCYLDPKTGREGSVQVAATTTMPGWAPTFLAGTRSTSGNRSAWTDADKGPVHSMPVLVNDGSQARVRFEAAFDEFRRLFPAALCYTKIVPVDEVVTLTLHYREDHHLARLLLDEAEAAELDQLWDELHYVSQDALTLVDAFEQLWQYATQDADPKVFEPLREPIQQRAAGFRQRLVETQPRHVEAVLTFAEEAYRRPLAGAEREELRALYGKLRSKELAHDDAVRLLIARVLMSPGFLYRTEKAPPGDRPAPVDDWELATRLSYFLWSSAPDTELRAAAARGGLRDPERLVVEARRMLRDGRVRRMATEFACAWLHVHGFDELGEKSERHFPTFEGLRVAMYEETIRFFSDLFENDGSVLGILNADHVFVNEALAGHYGIPGVTGPEWRRIEGAGRFGRGGILAQATTLAKQSGASRTSPILRGNWLSEVLLGEKLPRPPKDVPRLPEDEAAETLTVRELVEKHSSDPKCAGCHRRIDPYGFALEGYDAIGRRRSRDLGDRPVDTRTKAADGAEFDGLDGLRTYLLTKRRDAFVSQFCRKLLGYALGRGVMLSDAPLISEMAAALEAGGWRFSVAVEKIVRSPQFREIRGRDVAAEETP